ncbi:MAG TPA: hypothetical protein VGS57_07875 [Thermoanaerobaculia bacterium]|jgi:hypothetical protein|nr:hypothetical protein [Thermoanaerobaculia bacterium]
MAVTDTQPANRALRAPVRNRYFYGKLLDVYHFQLETDYMNAKRYLLNRLVSGYGVVCGLDVECEPDGQHVAVLPGVAIDKWGREIIVPERTCVAIPPELLVPSGGEGTYRPPKQGYGQGEDREEEGTFRLLLCYHECDSDPTPVLGGDCGTVEECAAGAIRERYRITFKEGPAPPIRLHCRVPDVFRGDRLDYEVLAKHVSQSCPEPPVNPCIPLANMRPGEHGCDAESVDITVRPIVYSNDLLLEVILSLLAEERDEQHRHK